jgi:hypothetical protein
MSNKYFLPWRASAESEPAYIVSCWGSAGTGDIQALEVRLGDRVYATQDLALDRRVPLGMEPKDFKEAVEGALKGAVSVSGLDVFTQLESIDDRSKCQVI